MVFEVNTAAALSIPRGTSSPRVPFRE
jgi:hypothetical protein